MAQKKLRVVHYINQFFGQIGGEDKADVGFSVKEGPVGPGMLLQKHLGDRGEIVGTISTEEKFLIVLPDKLL